MKHKHYYLLSLIVTILLVSCPVNHSSHTPPKPDLPVAPQDPVEPTADVYGIVAEKDITAWKDALSALVHCYEKVNNSSEISQEKRDLRTVPADESVVIQDPTNNITVVYKKDSYFSTNDNNQESNKSTLIAEISGKYKDSSESYKEYKVSVNGSIKTIQGESPTFTGTATYTEGSKTYKVDMNKVFSNKSIEDKNSTEYKVKVILDNIDKVAKENLVEEKYTFENYNYLSEYTFKGKTVGISNYSNDGTNNIFVSDQEYTDKTVSVTLPDGVTLIVRYDIKREGESKTITDTSYIHVKRDWEENFKVFPIGELTINDVEGEVNEEDVRAWGDALSALVHCYSKVDNSNDIYQEHSETRKVSTNKSVEILGTTNNILATVTYNQGSSFSYKYNNRDNNKWTANMDVSGKHSNKSFKVSTNDLSGNNEGGSPAYTGTATYTEGSTPYDVDMSKVFLGGYDKDSPEYKVNMLMAYAPYEYSTVEEKYTFTSYNHPSGYTFDGQTVGVGSYTMDGTNNIFVSDQEKTVGTVSVTLQGGVNLIVRYAIKREGDTNTITESSYMQVKKEGEEKFRRFPLESLTLTQQSNPVPQEPAVPITPSVPDIPFVPDEPDAPTTDIDGEVLEPEITAWTDALSALVHCPANGNVNNIYQETIALREFLVDTDVVIEATPNNIPVTYYKGSYFSQTMNNKESNKSTGLMEVSGKYNDSGKLFKVYLNGMNEYIVDGEAPSSTFTGTATYTEGSTPSKFDAIKAFSGGEIENTNSPEYKARLIMNNMPFAESKNKIKTTFTNYGHTNGYIFDGKTAGVEISRNNTFVSDQEYTNGTVSVTIKDDVQGDVKLIVRYDIKREGESKTITGTSYMHVKKEGNDKFRVFPLDQLTI